MLFSGIENPTQEIMPDSKKLSKVEEWPTPNTMQGIQQVLGLANCYDDLSKILLLLISPCTEKQNIQVD